MRVIVAIIALAMVATPSVASADHISGTYVGRSPAAAYLLQLVETPDGRLTGRFEQFVLRPGGKTEDMNAAITGAANGGTVVISIKPTGLLSTAIPASGSLQGDALHITGSANGSSFGMTLVRGDESGFRSQVTALSQRANEIGAGIARAASHPAGGKS